MALKIFAGRSNEALARAIVSYIMDPASTRRLDIAMSIDDPLHMGRLYEKRQHSDGESYTRFIENMRGDDVFIIQSTNQPDRNFKELLMMISTAVGASASRITAVIPYFGYARQDRKDAPRAPVTAVDDAVLIKEAGADRLLILDVHSTAVEHAWHAYKKQYDHLWARPVFLRHVRKSEDFTQFMEEGFVIGAPDLNASKFARGYAEAFGDNVPLVLIEKRRDVDTGKTETLNVIGDPSGKNVLIVDDMIDSGGTTGDAARAFQEKGAKRIFALSSHGVFLGANNRVSRRLIDSPVEKIVITDSIYRKRYPKGIEDRVEVVSIAELLGEAIFRIHTNQSVSSLFV